MTDKPDSASRGPVSTADEAIGFSQFMAEMKQQAVANSHMNRSERFKQMSASPEFRRYSILMKTRSRMIIAIAFLPLLVVLSIAAVLLYFYPNLASQDSSATSLGYLNGYVVMGLLFLYLVAATVFAYHKAYKVAFEKMRDMGLLEAQE